MAKKKSKKKATKKKAILAKALAETQEVKATPEKQLSPDEYEALTNSLEDFQESVFSFLAGTSQFEIVPTTDEFGNPIPEKNLELIRRECKRLGFRVLYSVEQGGQVLFINPDTMKIAIMTHDTEVH